MQVFDTYTVYIQKQKSLCIIDEQKSLHTGMRGFLKVFHLSALWWRVFPCIIDARRSTWHAVQRSINMQTRSEPPYNPTQSSSSLLFLWTAIKTGSECVIKPWLYTHSLLVLHKRLMWFSSSLLSKVSCFLGNHTVVLLRYLCCSISHAFAFVPAPLTGILANKTIWKDESCEESASVSLISLKLLRRTSIYRSMQREPTQHQRIWHQRRIKIKLKKELLWDWSLYYGLGQSDPQHIFKLSEILINMKVGFCHGINKKNKCNCFVSCNSEFTSHNSDFVSVMFTVSNEHCNTKMMMKSNSL